MTGIKKVIFVSSAPEGEKFIDFRPGMLIYTHDTFLTYLKECLFIDPARSFRFM